MSQSLFPDLPLCRQQEKDPKRMPLLDHADVDQVQFEIFPDHLLMRRIDPDRRMYRYYRMVVQRDLFGGASLIREWGRIGSAGQIRMEHHRDEGQAIDTLLNIVRAKRKRGYLM